MTEESNAATAGQMKQMDHELKMKDLQIRVTGSNSQPTLEMSAEVRSVSPLVSGCFGRSLI
jgi:hypothetical protein